MWSIPSRPYFELGRSLMWKYEKYDISWGGSNRDSRDRKTEGYHGKESNFLENQTNDHRIKPSQSLLFISAASHG